MLIYEDTTAVIASRACELAHTGAFEDYPAIERELFAEGFREEIDRAKKAALQSVITEICDTNARRRRSGDAARSRRRGQRRRCRSSPQHAPQRACRAF